MHSMTGSFPSNQASNELRVGCQGSRVPEENGSHRREKASVVDLPLWNLHREGQGSDLNV